MDTLHAISACGIWHSRTNTTSNKNLSLSESSQLCTYAICTKNQSNFKLKIANLRLCYLFFRATKNQLIKKINNKYQYLTPRLSYASFFNF